MVTEKKREITDDEILKFLEGHDPQERIVNIECFNNNDFATIYYRDENDIKHKTTEPFYPFLWARKTACLKLCNGDRNEIKRLLKKHNIAVKKLDTTNVNGEIVEKMNDGYTFMFYSTKPQSYSDFLKFFKEANNPVYRDNKKQQKESEDSSDIKQNDRQYLAITSVEQFLISTGKRMFKGYEDYDCLLRLIFDLETTGLDVNKDRIEQFGVRFNRPVLYKGKKYDFEKIFTVKGNTKEEKDKSELYNIENFLKIIYTFQPDVITAHNGEAFDWRIIIGACERLGTSLEEISKKYFNDTPIKKDNRETILKLGGEVETFNRTIVPYTIVTDSLHAVRRAQATDSNFKEANLKYATKYLELSKENRVYVPGNKISDVWNDTEKHYAFNDKNGDWYLYSPDSQKQFEFDGNTKRSIIKQFNNIGEGYVLVNGEYIVTRYLLDDLWECDKVESSLNQSAFNICKYLPLHFQKCCTMGTAGQWKSLMLAWSYENDLAIPYAENTGKFTGGLSRLLSVGSTGDGCLVKMDYNSLYPSIILTWGIEDENDLSGATLKFLNYFLTTRETYKKKKKEADKLIEKYEDKINNGQMLTEEESSIYSKALNNFAYYDKLQSVRKVFCNSFFGSYGSNRGSVYPWKSIDCAERTTCTGRMSLRLMIKHFYNLGYQPIVGDTDGFNFKLPNVQLFRYTKDHPYIGKGLSRETKEGKEYIEFEADLAEFNDLYMKDMHYSNNGVNKMGLGLDEKIAASINLSRKNYIDYFPDKPYPKDVKFVGNTVKSKKMPEYISIFIDKTVRLLLTGHGQEFINEYYSYIDKIYNYKIPIKQIASKGKVKKTIQEYKEDCNTLTKAGRPKSRQAWMELAIKNNLDVNLGETIYYINTGKSKSNADVKKMRHYYINEGLFDEKVDKKAYFERLWKKDNVDGKLAKDGNKLDFDNYVKKHYPNVVIEDEIILSCSYIPQTIVDSEEDVFCEEGQEYNVPKYIEQFNKRITPLLVCFKPEIRNRILITNPDNKPYFTADECELCGGYPNKSSDQDTLEQLMTMDDKEIKFWENHPQWNVPFLKECGMDWNEILSDYHTRMEREKELGINKVRELFENTLAEMSSEDFDKFSEGEIPKKLVGVIELDPSTGDFVSKDYPDIIIGTINDVLDAEEYKSNMLEDADYEV